jgi:hypothetical protein
MIKKKNDTLRLEEKAYASTRGLKRSHGRIIPLITSSILYRRNYRPMDIIH